MTLYKRRKKFSGFSASVGKAFGRFGSANAYTVLALLAAFIAAYFLLVQNFICAAVFFAAGAFLDAVDGAVARYRKSASARGAYFDTVSDRYMEGIIALVILLVPLPPFYLPSYFWAALYLFGSMTVTYVKAAAKEKLNREISGGLLERPERMIIVFIGILLAYFNAAYLTYVLVLLAVLANITALQRIRIAVKERL
ncbi:MAG: CDP-diacylglycerol-glycerol-3-phosphate 3-phosphatidyltransferase [archaeon GW2011_AR5]|nr:MAG: CDP-diacylglycerol-glycerol-3-phosphate 3-phosphatidyltransferase [archaeon GW2011_AR5]MBS3051579.1 CDP-alcohol phosphatidyltransferase family protein [Candidatus Aenigmarchaeota archaeon]